MILTPAEETALLQKYDSHLIANVRAYCRRVSLPYSDCQSDLLQEARIAFLLHIRRIENEDDICKCGYKLLNALCLAKEAMHVVRIPHWAYKMESEGFIRHGDDATTDMPHNAYPGDVADKMAVDQFLDSLPVDERTIVSMRMAGYRAREILPHTSLCSNMQITRCIEQVKSKAKEFFSFNQWPKGD